MGESIEEAALFFHIFHQADNMIAKNIINKTIIEK